MRTLIIMAHYDPTGRLAPHALRQIDALADVADRLIVVSTAALQDADDVEAITKRAELVSRTNYGYDFYSYKTGLDQVDDIDRYDTVIVCNDSYVGPLVPYRRMLDTMRARQVDFWGITQTRRRALHVQSYFVAFRSWVVRSAAFQRFWGAMTPVSDRLQVITKYEVGLSRTLLEAGFALGSYFEEDDADRRLARARHLWWAYHTVQRQPRHRRRAALRQLPFEPWNPMAALADRALDGARLPLVKIDTLRYDPYGLGSMRLLAACEEQHPDMFDGTREYLELTASLYPARPAEAPGPVVPPWPVRRTIGYAR
jgi:lipopolysaccharide biosynthesis protein